MATKASVKNKRQMVLLVALLIVLGYYVLHTFVFTGSSSRSTNNAQTRTASSPTKPPSGAASRQQGSNDSEASPGAKIQLLLDDKSPLDLGLLAKAGGGPATPGERGNIFDYYKEPIKPPPPLPPPPPIRINYLQPQTVVAGTPRAFKLSVSGNAFPGDAQILVNSSPRQTKRINETTLTTDIPAGEYATQRSMTIEVKSQADPVKLYSNPMTFVVQPSPDPPFKYVGRIGDLVILEVGNKEFARLTRGSTVQGVWRIEAISDAGVDVIHTQLEIRKRVAMQDKGR
jgi:hypothetical protein